MKVVALIEAFNEERCLPTCLFSLREQGVFAYLVDNSSTDRTLEIATSRLGQEVIGVETAPRDGVFSLRAQLERKERLAASLDADWFIHMDADEIRLPPPPHRSLHDALVAVDCAGFNAVSFMEFVFTPTREHPDHDHPRYAETMRWYYAFRPRFVHRLNAWKRQPAKVELSWSAGHQVRFPGRRDYPCAFPMKHYLFLSLNHAVEKYVRRSIDPVEKERGWFRWRGSLDPEAISLPSEAELRVVPRDGRLDDSNPRTTHYLARGAASAAGRP